MQNEILVLFVLSCLFVLVPKSTHVNFIVASAGSLSFFLVLN